MLTGLAVFGLLTSSINWMSNDPTRSIIQQILRQGAFAYNFLLAPFVLLPLIYVRMGKTQDHATNLQGLLFFLILPSTLILLLAKLVGTPANVWEASLHVESLPEGFIEYQLGKVLINFLRTEIGFILAALICASTAIAISRVRRQYRWVAGACLASNTFLLFVTASFGSGLACICGLAAIFYVQSRVVNVTRVLVSVAAIACMVLLTYSLAPSNVKEYVGKRYEHHITDADTDRLGLWERAVDQFFEHPEGVGLTLSVGDKVKSFIHNDYLTYAVSYGVTGGLAYTFLILGLMVSFFQRRKSRIKDPAALAVYLAGLGVIVAVAVNSMTDHMTENRWYFNLIWSLIWYSYFCSRAALAGVTKKGTRYETANSEAKGV